MKTNTKAVDYIFYWLLFLRVRAILYMDNKYAAYNVSYTNAQSSYGCLYARHYFDIKQTRRQIPQTILYFDVLANSNNKRCGRIY